MSSDTQQMALPPGWSVAWSEQIDDPDWDAFLLGSPYGQFQQASAWAESKGGHPWSVARATWADTDRCLGGFQLLHRRTRFGRIGYVSKGPVLAEETDQNCRVAVRLLREAARRLGLIALVAQAPDRARELPRVMLENGFQRERLMQVIEYTLIVDLTVGVEQLQRGMRARTRAEVRQAERRGVTIREGTELDLAQFFELMLRSCRRQDTQPNPGSLVALTRFYQAHHRRRQVRLTFADADGLVLAACLSLLFGQRVTAWKQGWSGEGRHRHPMTALVWDAMGWAVDSGYREFDFAALDPELAHHLLCGDQQGVSSFRGRDFFKVGFGGDGVQLAPSCAFLPGRVMRLLYSILGWLPALRGPLRRHLARRS